MSLDKLFRAIATVESRSRDHVVGDAGELGRYQITYSYWFSSGVKGRHEGCKNPEYSRRVMLAYWKRFCSRALEQRDYEMLAKHHRTLDIYGKSARVYWKKIRRVL